MCRDALTGERGLVDLQGGRRDDAPVGGNLVAGGEQDDVPDDDPFGGDLEFGPTSPDPCRHLHHRLERVHGALRLALLTQAHDRVEEGECEEQDGGVPLADRRGHDGRADQDQLHVRAVLVDEAQPAWLGLLFGKRVGPACAQQCSRPFSAVTDRRVHAESRRHLSAGQRIPEHSWLWYTRVLVRGDVRHGPSVAIGRSGGSTISAPL